MAVPTLKPPSFFQLPARVFVVVHGNSNILTMAESFASHSIVDQTVPKLEKRFSIWSSVMAEQESKDVVRNGVKVDTSRLSKDKKRKYETRDVEDYEFWKKDANRKAKFVKPGSKKSTKKLKRSKKFKKLQCVEKKFESKDNLNNDLPPTSTSEIKVENKQLNDQDEWVKKLSKSAKKRLKRKSAKDQTCMDIAVKLREPRIDLISKLGNYHCLF